MTYTLKRLGFINPVEIERVVDNEKTIIISKSLTVNEIVEEWRWLFNDFEKMVVNVDGKLLRSMEQRTLANSKSVKELFYEQNIIFNEIKEV